MRSSHYAISGNKINNRILSNAYLFTAKHDPKHVGLHNVDNVLVFQFGKRFVLVTICPGIVDPAQ